MQPCLFIGGVGGSGTRVLCSIAQALGLNMGSDLNKAQDSLWFSLLFMRPGMLSCPETEFRNLARLYGQAFSGGGLSEHQEHYIRELGNLPHSRWTPEWVCDRAESFIQSAKSEVRRSAWGWKEPNSHIFAEKFLKLWPKVKYVHMWRDGVDMSVSKNQNQIKFWGNEYPKGPYYFSKRSALSYWVNVHKNIVNLSMRFPGRVNFVNFEDLCQNSLTEIKKFTAFSGQSVRESDLKRLCDLVKEPKSIGRGDEENIAEYNLLDYNYAKNFKLHLKELPQNFVVES